MSFFKKIPLGIAGVALATAGLGNLLYYPGGVIPEPFSIYLRYTFGAIALFALILLILQVAFDLPGVRQDLRSPVVFSMLPASTMATILLTIYLVPYAPAVAKSIWAAAAILQVCIIALFAKRFVFNFKLENVYPSWYVAAVGIQAIAIASPHMDALPIGQFAFWVGLTFYFCVTVLVIARYIKHQPLPEKYRPTIMVLTAPMGICIVGYIAAFPIPSIPLLTFMMIVGSASYLIALYALPKLATLPFYPSLAALGFPMVVSGFAFKKGSELLNAQVLPELSGGLGAWIIGTALPIVAYFAESMAILVVCYVIIRYGLFLLGQIRQQPC